MKKKLVLTAAVVLVLGVGGCGGAGAGSDGGYAPVKSSDRAVFLGDFAGNKFIGDFKARFTNRSAEVDGSTKVIVLDGSYPSNDEVIPAIVTAYQAGAVIVLVRPSQKQQMASTDAIEHKTALHHVSENASVCDMYAFNKFDDHHIFSMEGNYSMSGKVTQGGETVEYDPDTGEEISTTPNVPADYVPVAVEPVVDTAPFFDIIVAWIDAQNNNEKGDGARGAAFRRDASRAAADDVSAMINAQQVVYTYLGASRYATNSGRACKSIPVSDIYLIWAVYDKINHADYYVVQEDVTIPNSGLGYIVNESKDRYKDTAFYLHSFNVNHFPLSPNGAALPLNTGAILMKHAPETANNATTVSSGFSWTLGGSLGFSGMGGTGGVSASMTHTDSESRTITDFVETNLCLDALTQANAKWDYSINHDKLPKKDKPAWNHANTVNIEGAPALATGTAQFHNVWVWEILNTGTGTDAYKMRTEGQTTYGNSWAHADGTWAYSWCDAEDGPTYNNTVNLTPPPRS
jgi:hypothetical protein